MSTMITPPTTNLPRHERTHYTRSPARRTAYRLVLVIGLLLPAAGWAETNPHLKQGRELLQNAEDERAQSAFQRALAWPHNSREQSVTAHLYLGIVHYNLMQRQQARQNFAAALKLRADAQLPHLTSPKIAALFEQVRNQLGAERAAQRAREAAQKRSKTRGAASAAPPRPSTTSPSRTSPEGRRRLRWPVWTALGLAGASGLAGLVVGISARSLAEDANDLALTYPAAKALRDRAASRALAANILFGAAGAAALGSALLFWLSPSHGRADSPRLALMPEARGASLHYCSRFY